MKNLLFLIFLTIAIHGSAQVAINTDNSMPDNSAMLDVKSTTNGLLIPRMTQAQRNVIDSPAPWLLIFQTDNSPGIYFNAGTNANPVWMMVATGSNWSLTGNSGTSVAANFIGTTDNTPLTFRVNNQLSGKIDHILFNTSLGFQSLLSNTTGSANSAFGYQSLGSNSSGNNNTATGYQALFNNLSGNYNTASGYQSLISNLTGSFNTALGYQSLYFNTEGNENTATGYRALNFNATGNYNTANGKDALYSNNSGSYNTASGFQALYSNTTGISNTACGVNGLYTNTDGDNNMATGYSALNSNTTGSYNTASGSNAIFLNTAGSYNTANGFSALYNNTTASQNIAIGSRALLHQSFSNGGSVWNSNNVAVGYEALYSNQPTSTTSGIQNTAVGNYALRSNTIGFYNTACGSEAMYSNTTGNHNTAYGFVSLYTNIGGVYNTACGYKSLYLNTTGSFNTAGGYGALNSNTTGDNNTANGIFALYYVDTQSDNTAIGYSAGDYYKFDYGTFVGRSAYPNASGYSNITGLGYNARPTASNQIRIGNTAVTSIGGYAGWTDFSDGRFKKNVSENVPGLAFISQLRPVTYNLDISSLNTELDKNKPATLREDEPTYEETPEERAGIEVKEKIAYTGFIAQEVEEAARRIGYDFSGVDTPDNENDFYGLRYAEFVVPLVKAVQEQQLMIDELKALNITMQAEIEKLKEQYKGK
jgi:hypothetical protein